MTKTAWPFILLIVLTGCRWPDSTTAPFGSGVLRRVPPPPTGSLGRAPGSDPYYQPQAQPPTNPYPMTAPQTPGYTGPYGYPDQPPTYPNSYGNSNPSQPQPRPFPPRQPGMAPPLNGQPSNPLEPNSVPRGGYGSSGGYGTSGTSASSTNGQTWRAARSPSLD